MIEIGHVEAIFRYPVKSMAGQRLDAAELGFHGIEGDRRLALRRMNDRSGFPWLTASKLPELILFTPHFSGDGELPSHICTPDGKEPPTFSEELADEIGSRHGSPVEMMQMKHGIFDDACISVIASDTVGEIGRLAGINLDVRRFRPNILVRLSRSAAFQEDKWVGGALSFGSETGPMVSVTMRDIRCAMLNLDPDTAKSNPEVMKAVFRVNENTAGIYGTVIRTGQLEVGQTIFLHPAISTTVHQ